MTFIGFCKLIILGGHPRYVRHTRTEEEVVTELDAGTKYTTYNAEVFKHTVTGNEVTVHKDKEKMRVEWDDGTTTHQSYW